jgi:hypothetical protein
MVLYKILKMGGEVYMFGYKFVIYNNNILINKKIKFDEFDSFMIELKTKYKNYNYIYTYIYN